MQLRHEVKHEINRMDMLVLRSRLSAVMSRDRHTTNGVYHIRSLYFDNIYDKALREKLDGVSVREKYRLRMYNHDTSMIRLERKFKRGSLGSKDTAVLTKDEAAAIINGDIEWMAKSDNDVILGFYTRLKNEGLLPKVIVDYTREPFVFAPGNVRVTLDYDIRTGIGCTDFFNPDSPSLPIRDDACILEVKWDNFLPDIVKNAVQLDCRRCGAFSKYAACRMYD